MAYSGPYRSHETNALDIPQVKHSKFKKTFNGQKSGLNRIISSTDKDIALPTIEIEVKNSKVTPARAL